MFMEREIKYFCFSIFWCLLEVGNIWQAILKTKCGIKVNSVFVKIGIEKMFIIEWVKLMNSSQRIRK